MPKLLATSQLIVIVKISIVWAIDSSTCGHLPQYNAPHLTHSNPTQHWPWHAAIYHRHADSDPTYECGGTVVSRNSILTAAHCMFRNGVPLTPQEISVSLGRLDLAADETRSEQSFNVTKILLHENYGPTYLENDIALVRLSHSATFNNFVRPICLWKTNETEFYRVTERYGTVVGWGKTEAYKISTMLQEAHFRVVSHTRCLVSNRDFYGSYLTETNFCAGLRNGTSVCKGDSGGSMTFEEDGLYYIRGIVSSSPSKINHTTQRLDCDTMEYAIYTDVAMYLQWIRDKIGAECQAEVRCVKRVNLGNQQECKIDVHSTNEICEIIFDESSDSTITSLRIGGEFESIPYMSDAITKFENLESLHMQNINLKVVERGRLTAFRKIKELDLSYNQIAHLNTDTFGDLKELRKLLLISNKIKELRSEIFTELYSITEINLDKNNLETVPEGLFRDNQQLQEISLGRNQLRELRHDIFRGLHNLTKIFLHENQLESLPVGIFQDNDQLQKISISENVLKELHADTFRGIHSLTMLYLGQNQLVRLPQGLFRDNRQLQGIELYGNQLKELHVDLFQGLHSLTKLYLYENQLETLPQGLFRDNEQLQGIFLSNNLLRELHVDIFRGLNNTKEIYLHTNKLESLPQGLFRENHQLQEILVSTNLLRELHPDIFQGLDNLGELYLYENQFENLPQGLFRDNPKLYDIRLFTNRIVNVQSDFSHLSMLRRLDFRQNVCIDELFEYFDVSEVNDKIRTKCSS